MEPEVYIISVISHEMFGLAKSGLWYQEGLPSSQTQRVYTKCLPNVTWVRVPTGLVTRTGDISKHLRILKTLCP